MILSGEEEKKKQSLEVTVALGWEPDSSSGDRGLGL